MTPQPSSTETANDRTVQEFEASYSFPFDDFQRRACRALLGGSSVLVAAPTGAGKTVVGEFAAWLALRGGGKAFYTTPIKALSNQKYTDFVAAHGAGTTGLLTGDNSINGHAATVVMTTEVLRNMIYEDSDALVGLRYVVLDEVHYLQDRYRGAVWEEILIHLPVDVQIISLSATVSNAEEFAEWLQTLRGRTEVIIEERRPVEIRHWYMTGEELLPMFVRKGSDVAPNPRGLALDRRKRSARGPRPPKGGHRNSGGRAKIPWRTDVVDRLYGEQMLPAIYFIFSRKGCTEAVRQCLRESIVLTTPDQRRVIRDAAEARVSELSPSDLDILGYSDWISGLERGIASHHAGMIPPFKEIVEELFAAGLVKVVFATETLALGINMPARTVVIESLMKFTGEKHELITPGQFTQLSGRAGRRGKDELGHAVVLKQRFTQFDAITRLASTRTYPLRSSFQPSYNMAVNLIRNYDLAEAEHLVNSSFAQFQTDRGVVQLERSRESLEAYLASYRERSRCELGDVDEYSDLTRRLHKIEGKKGAVRSRVKRVSETIAGLSPGDLIEVKNGRRRGRYVVIEILQRRSERRPRMLVLDREGSLVRLGPADLPDEPERIGALVIGPRHNVGDPTGRAALAEALRDFTPPAAASEGDSDGYQDEADVLRDALRRHPVAKCPELGRHLHFMERARRLVREIRSVEKRISRTSGTLARRFDQVLAVLESMGYVRDWTLSRKGTTLSGIYNESDLLVVESLESGLFEGLDIPETAAIFSTLVYETRGPEGPLRIDLPTKRAGEVWRGLMKVWRRVRVEEEGRQLDLTREPDPGFATKTYRWAQGRDLEQVMDDQDAPGDFVRSMKQLIDLLRQVEEVVPPGDFGDQISGAVTAINRGIVAYSSVEI